MVWTNVDPPYQEDSGKDSIDIAQDGRGYVLTVLCTIQWQCRGGGTVEGEALVCLEWIVLIAGRVAGECMWMVVWY
jgi:hypothetical protein